MDDFSKMRQSKFRNNTTTFRKFSKSFNLSQDFANQPFTHVRNQLVCVPLTYAFEIFNG
jgi:hypothetical protein